MMRRLFLCLALLALSSVPSGEAFAASGFPWTYDRIRNWGPEFMSDDHGYTQAEAVVHAQTFDVLIALKSTYKNHVSAMRAANPDLVLLVYQNGGYAAKIDGTRWPDFWYARDASGNKIQSVGWGTWLMTPTNWGWRNQVANQCVANLAESGYDGCFVDSLGTAALYPGYCTGLPINPATGKVWTEAAWLDATSDTVGTVKTAAGSSLVVPNGVRFGVPYFDPAAPSEQLITPGDGGVVELFMRSPNAPIDQHRTEAEWKEDVDMLVDAGQQSSSLLVVTKTWTTGTQLQKDNWHRFALATFLLGMTGRSYFAYTYDRPTALVPNPWWDLQLGTPSGQYYQSDNVYQRIYGLGKVLVNPTSTTRTVPLGGTYKDLDGVQRSSVTLGPYSGTVLVEV